MDLSFFQLFLSPNIREKLQAPILGGALLLFLACCAVFPVRSIAQESTAQAVSDARQAISQALAAGADKVSPAEFELARSWFAQAQKAYASATSMLGMVATGRQRRLREDEIIFFANMARIKAETAEASARKVSVIAGQLEVQRVLSDYQRAISLAARVTEEAAKSRADAAGADADRRQLAEAQVRLAELEARRAAADAEAQRLALEEQNRAEERRRDAEAKAREDSSQQSQLAEMRAKVQAFERERVRNANASEVPGASLRSGNGMVVFNFPVSNLFDASNELSAQGRQSLEVLGKFAAIHSKGPITVRSFTDSRGAAAANRSLSERRADKVRRFLLGNGLVPDAQIQIDGLGATEPISSNDTEAGRALNRRVEVTVAWGD